ncbi:DUF5375 domain-containing protein [Mixta hanseatica]|uniref:DUF5375 domain-containing protein n=1 Tax=Mixta hanseatica TaxID=2872648 RepID=A0ABY4R7R0_9GAMM|nr:DUF5375 domain-containing protein [Mixta hanseatica]
MRWHPWWRCLPTSWGKWSAPVNPSCLTIWRSPVTTNQSCLPVEVRTAVYRRAVAQGYLSACEHYGLDVSASLDEVQMTIALELEGYYVRKYGPENGMDMACTMLSEMVQPDVLVAAPRLTRMGETMMDELLCGRLAASKATLH